MNVAIKAVMFSAFFLLPLQAAPQVYKWVDEQGKTVYSSTPPPGGKKSAVVPIPASPPPPATDAKTETKPPAAKPGAPDTAAEVSYASAKIAAPAHEETIWSNTGEVQVSLALEPALQKGHKVRVIVDGAPRGEPWEAPQGTVRDLERGPHLVQAEVIDRSGRTVATTNSVTIYLQQASALSPTRKK